MTSCSSQFPPHPSDIVAVTYITAMEGSVQGVRDNNLGLVMGAGLGMLNRQNFASRTLGIQPPLEPRKCPNSSLPPPPETVAGKIPTTPLNCRLQFPGQRCRLQVRLQQITSGSIYKKSVKKNREKTVACFFFWTFLAL